VAGREQRFRSPRAYPAVGQLIDHAEAAAAAEVQGHVGPGPAHAGHQVGQVVVGPQGRVDVARPQGQQDELVVVGAADDQWQVLVLIVVPMPEGDLRVAM
jgi:hypothetical protein